LVVKYIMKKIVLSIIGLFFVIQGYSQNKPGESQNKPASLDSLINITFPQGFKEKDTLNEKIFTGNGMYGYMIAIRQANAAKNTPLKKQSDLNKVFKDIVADIKAQTGGSAALNVRDTTIGTLKAKTFTLDVDNGGAGSIIYRNFVLLYTQDATYTFEYVYPDDRTALVKDEYKAFIGSIKLSPELQRNDQYLSNATGMSTANKVEIFGGGALVLLVILVLVFRKKKQPSLG